MNFTKTAKTHKEQIELLKERGLNITNTAFAEKTLSNISYYRLRAYWLTFENAPNDLVNHSFKPNVSFEQIINTYEFDRKLRHIVFKAIERIEIALRTKLIYHITLNTKDIIWYSKQDNYKSINHCESFKNIFIHEYNNSHEIFIKHYKNKYTSPELPPAWMALEILSFGQLSLLFKNVNLTSSKKEIGSYFGVHYKLLESWFEALSYIRNVCAHHGRLWNKKIPKPPIYPNRINIDWLEIEPSEDKKNRLYVILAIIDLLLYNIDKNNEFRKELFSLIDQNLEIPLHYIGFPVDWRSDSFWQVNE